MKVSRGGEIRNDVTIMHAFADEGVESEALSAYGRVVRFGIDPREGQFSKAITYNLKNLPDRVTADLGFLHPPCKPWSRMTKYDYENLIGVAREIGKEQCDHYVIENLPKAPLKDATVLQGYMFGLPIVKRRAFETSFPLSAPSDEPLDNTIDTEVSPYYYSDRSTVWWRSVMGVSDDYRKEPLAKGGIPAAYVHHIMRAWLRHIHPTDSKEARSKT